MKITINYFLLLFAYCLTVKGSDIELPSTLEASQTPLMQAAAGGNIKSLKELSIHVHDEPPYYLSHTDINTQDKQGRTALFIAAQEGQANIVEELLKVKDIDVNLADKDGMTPLQVAVTSGDPDTVNALLDACEKISGKCKNIDQKDKKLKYTPLARAARSGNTEIIKLLLAAGANPMAQVRLGDKYISLTELVKPDDKEAIALIQAKIQEYTDRGLEFIKALQDRKPDQVRKLLDAGINVNAKGPLGYTPLHWAGIMGYKDIADLLIKLGADINAKNKGGFTLLYEASRENLKDIVELLIAYGADVNAKTLLGSTALDWAVDKGHKDIAQMLINAGADVNAKQLHKAGEEGHTDIVDMLRKAGAKD